MLSNAHLGARGPTYMSTMDLTRCFDRLDLDNLLLINEKLGLDSCTHTLRNYRALTTLLFIDNESTHMWLQATNDVGIPQGCPMACFLCNLTALVWHVVCKRVNLLPSISLTTKICSQYAKRWLTLNEFYSLRMNWMPPLDRYQIWAKYIIIYYYIIRIIYNNI